MAVYFAVLEPGDTILGMDLVHGGHLTHGHPLNFSGKLLRRSCAYGVAADDERIDYDEVRAARRRAPAEADRRAAPRAYPRIIDFERFRADRRRGRARC